MVYSISSSIGGEFILSFHETIEDVQKEVEEIERANPHFECTLDRINEICSDKENEKNKLSYIAHDFDEQTGDFVSIEMHDNLTLNKGK